MVRTLIFDCDGVLADTERYGHLPAFNQTFREFGIPVEWSVEEYGVKLLIAGGKERMGSLWTPEFVKANGLPEDPEGKAILDGIMVDKFIVRAFLGPAIRRVSAAGRT